MDALATLLLSSGLVHQELPNTQVCSCLILCECDTKPKQLSFGDFQKKEQGSLLHWCTNSRNCLVGAEPAIAGHG